MKNSTHNHTESFKRMRDKEWRFIKETPFYGNEKSEGLYKILKKNHNVLQVGICGKITSIVTYKKDADLMRTYLSAMFPERIVKQKTSELTELVTTYTI